MTALCDRLIERIQMDGPIPLDRFMVLALQDPKHGYYVTRDPLGADGDFATAPEISQIFGELLGLWAVDLWARMGEPASLRLIELGPGRGTLMADALRAARVAPRFLEAVDVCLIETSPVLTERQRAALASAPVRVNWRERFEDAPGGPAIVFANEFFDALPVRQYVNTPQGWRERLVGLDEAGRLNFVLAPLLEQAIRVRAPDGAVIEVGIAARRFASGLARRLVDQGGCALILDYGYVRAGLGETLQAMRRGAPVAPLQDPGEVDLTAHVDFAALAKEARAQGARVRGPLEQGAFLRRLGLAERAERLARAATPAQRESLMAGAARIADPSHERAMGALFKVLAIASPQGPEPTGFQEAP